MSFEIRWAEITEVDWVNHHYDEIGFMRSQGPQEKVIIAALHTHKVGMGRLVSLDEHHLELAGIYVLQPYRRQKIATRIIEHLVSQREPHQTIYCIAFIHLVGFYKRLGFACCQETQSAPKAVLEKFTKCQTHYRGNVKLLLFRNQP